MLPEPGEDNTLKLPCAALPEDGGEKDRMISSQETAAIAGILPNGECKTLADSPHPLEKVDVRMLTGMIKDFTG